MSLKNYYLINFQLIHLHKYSLTEMENLIPWERDVYMSQLINYIQAENERIKLAQIERQSKSKYTG